MDRGATMVRRAVTINWFVPVLVLVVGLLVARSVLTLSAYYLFVGVTALVLGLALARNLQPGMFAYMFIAALAFGESPGVQSPHSSYSAGLMPSQVLLLFLAAIWFGRALLADGFKLVKSELNLPLAALGGVALLSLVTNNILTGTRDLLFHQLIITQVAEVGLLGFSICAFFLTANTLRSEKWVRLVFVPVVLLALCFAAHRIFGFAVPMIWGSFLLAAGVALVYARLAFEPMGRMSVLGLSLLLAIMLYAAFSNLSWVSGWVAAGVAVTVVSFYRSRWLGLAIVLLGVFAMFVYPGVYQHVHIESAEGGDFDRFVIWADAFRMFTAVNPVLGIGPGNYHPFVYYHNTLWFGGTTYTTAHSNYVQIAAELGLVGLAAFLWVIIGGIRAGNRAARICPPSTRWLGVGATAVFAAIAVASLFGDYLFPSRGNNGIVTFGTTVYTWLVMGAAVAAANLASRESSADH